MDGINQFSGSNYVSISYMIYSEISGIYPLNKGSWMTTFLSIILDLMTQLTGRNAYCITQKKKHPNTLTRDATLPRHGFLPEMTQVVDVASQTKCQV